MDNLFPIGFVGEERKPAYLKSQILEHLSELNILNIDEVYEKKWLKNETILVIDNDGCEYESRANDVDKWAKEWIAEINNYINL